METYSINDVENITGVKAHTLRIWEKRYKTLIPSRTATKIRYYNDEQLRRLLNIVTLQQHGHKISKIMAYSELQINELLLESVEKPGPGDQNIIFVNNLVSAMIVFDEPLFDKIFSNIFIRYGVYDAMIKVVYPFLKMTGILWSTSNVIPAQEHFASNIIKRKLLAAIDGLPFRTKEDRKYLLFLPPNEWHEIGLLFADYILKNNGAETIYLGQNVPYDSLATAVEKVNPNYAITFFTAGIDIDSHLETLSSIANENKQLKILICSAKPNVNSGVLANIILLDDPVKIFDYV